MVLADREEAEETNAGAAGCPTRCPTPARSACLTPTASSSSSWSSPPPSPLALPDKECVICLDGERTHALVPCGHMILCKACAEKQQLADCPICQQVVTHIIRVWAP